MSEYITVGHYVVQDARTKAGGWRYYSAPEWFVLGLQEYDGIFHTTDTNRETVSPWNSKSAKTILRTPQACNSAGICIELFLRKLLI
jgi:hypothetical protein